MSGVTVVPLEDVAPVDLPGGSWSKLLIDSNTVSGTATTMGFSTFAGHTATAHMRHEVEELAYVVSGRGVLVLDDGEVEMTAGTATYIPTGVWHTVANRDDDDLTMVFVFAYPEYPPTDRRSTPESAHDH